MRRFHLASYIRTGRVVEISMVVDVKFAAKCILLLNSHKWYVDVRYLANVLRMSCEEFQEAVDALKNGGLGTRSTRTN